MIAAALGALLASNRGLCQAPMPTQKGFPLWKFDEMTTYPTCRAKGRLQDREYCDSKLIDQIVEKGKAAIPILISQLTDNRPTRRPIFDYWRKTTAADVAGFVLDSLFTDADWKTFTMPGLNALRHQCNDDAETCQLRFLKAHGRKFVQEQWLAAWNTNKDRIYWDDKARCFRVSKGPVQ